MKRQRFATLRPRNENPKGAVDKGDTKAVLIEQSSFALFNSGVFSTNKTKFREAEKLAKAVVEAATLGDASALKSAYAAYFKYIEKKSGYSGATDGQGLGSEFDYKNRCFFPNRVSRVNPLSTILHCTCTILGWIPPPATATF